MHQFHKFILSYNSTCFGQFLCPSSGVYSLYTQQWYMPYRFVDSLRAGPGWNCRSILFLLESCLLFFPRSSSLLLFISLPPFSSLFLFFFLYSSYSPSSARPYLLFLLRLLFFLLSSSSSFLFLLIPLLPFSYSSLFFSSFLCCFSLFIFSFFFLSFFSLPGLSGTPSSLAWVIEKVKI